MLTSLTARKWRLALLWAWLLAMQAHGATSYEDCQKARKDDLQGQVRCGEAEIRRRQTQMASAYQQARSALVQEYGAEHPMISQLKDNQAAWEKYRDTLCALRIGRGGLWSALEYNECQLDMVQQRLDWLKARDF